MKIDLHTHTIASGHAFSTIAENAAEAAKRGIKLMAVTDHAPALPGASGKLYFMCGDRCPKMIKGVRILFGVEANIIDKNGNLDLSEEILKKLDFVMAGFHIECGYEDAGIEKNTEAFIKAMQNPYVKIMSHPYTKRIKTDIVKVTEASIKHNVLLEINNSYFYGKERKNEEMWNDIKTMVKILKKNGKKMLINSDAHNAFEVGQFDKVIKKFGELGITKKDLLNYDVKGMMKFLNVVK